MREKFHAKYGPRPARLLSLPPISDREFEQLVYDAILRNVIDRGIRDCPVNLTPKSADMGRDIAIPKYTGGRLLGFTYSTVQARKILVECKLVGNERLKFEHVAANALQLQGVGPANFLLVTNGTLTPKTLALIQTHCDRLGWRFQLIDAYNFGLHFSESDAGSPLAQAVYGSDQGDLESLQLSYQVFRNREPDPQGFTIQFAARAFGVQAHRANIALHSTRDWSQGARITSDRLLEGDDVAAFTLQIRPRRAKLTDSVKVVLRIDGHPELFEIALSEGDELIDLPLFGKSIRAAIGGYSESLRRGAAPNVFHLHGASGTGKSRLIREIVNRIGFIGRRLSWFRMRDDGTAVVEGFPPVASGQRLPRITTQQKVLAHLSNELHTGSNSVLIILDDLHLASEQTIDALEGIAFSPIHGPSLILAGRSDPLSRRARYEAFAQLVADNARSPHQEQLVLHEFTGPEVADALVSLMPSQGCSALSGLTPRGGIRPIELVHFLHSLLERGFIYWLDENSLAVSADIDNARESDALPGPSDNEILAYRLEYLITIDLGDFSLAEVFVLLALTDTPALTFAILNHLRDQVPRLEATVNYWFDRVEPDKVAFFGHDTIREFLRRRFYRFDKPLRLGAAIRQYKDIESELNSYARAAISLHERDFAAAAPALTELARRLRYIRNISSLNLESGLYDDLASVIFLLTERKLRHLGLLLRIVIARAYLNIHSRSFVDGLLDCLELMSLADGLEKSDEAALIQLAVRQLMAHGLLNSGDMRTAITLMHEIENTIGDVKNSRFALAIEFDMCDRLQSYYAQQSAFDLAKSFLVRGRARAYRGKDETLINISLSGEFHLFRYLDVEEGYRMAIRQKRHADLYAPPRLKLHAEVNEQVANWSRSGPIPPDGTVEFLNEARQVSERYGYGHLIPRLDYLRAVDAYIRLDQGEARPAELLTLVDLTRHSAFRYGYSEYIWLSDNLRLLYSISASTEQGAIELLVKRMLDSLNRNGLTFIAGNYLCCQNVVVLSNALRALYVVTDDETALRSAEQVTFSPLACSTRAERDRRLRAVFDGALLCPAYDAKAVIRDRLGYFTILV
jgi:hypothetical protein